MARITNPRQRGAAEIVVQRTTNYLLAHPEVLVGILEGIIKSKFGPDPEMSSSVINTNAANLGMNATELLIYLKNLFNANKK